MIQGVEETVCVRETDRMATKAHGACEKRLSWPFLCLTTAAELGHLRISVCDLTKAITIVVTY